MSEPKEYVQEKVARLAWDYRLSNLEGRLLTIVDASTADPIQRKALKDVVRSEIWSWTLELPELKSEGLDSPNFTVKSHDWTQLSQGSTT